MKLGIFSALLLLQAATAAQIDVPVVGWGAELAFAGKNNYDGRQLNENQISDILNEKKEKVDGVALLLIDDLRRDQMTEFSSVAALVENAGSSAVYPRTIRSSEGLLESLKTPALSVEQFKAQYSTDKKVQGIMPIVLKGSPAEINKQVDDVTALLAEAKVAFFFTGSKAAALPATSASIERRLAEAEANAVATLTCARGYFPDPTNKFCFTHYVMITPTILAGLLIGFFMIYLAVVGIMQLDSIQTPVRYATRYPAKGREF